MRRSLFSILMLLVFGGLVVGCGGNNRDFVVTGNNNVPTGTVTLQFATARGDIRGQFAPAGSDSVRVSGFDSTNVVRFGPQTLPIATTIVIQNVPVSVVRMDGEFLLGGTTLGRFSEAVTVTEGGNTTITNPTLLPAVDGDLNQLAAGDYFLVAGTQDVDRATGVERESNVAADITLDGNGNIAAGAVSTVQHDGTVAGAHLGGTYTLFADGSMKATLNSILSTVNFEGGIEGGVGQGNPMGFVQGVLDMDNGNTVGSAYLVLRGSGLSNTSLNGAKSISLFFTSVGDTNGAVGGDLTFDGAGSVTAGTLTSTVLNDKFQTTGDFTLAGGSTYSVAANGDFLATLNFGTFTLNLSGVVGVDGQVICTAVIPGNASGIGRIDEPQAQVTTRGTGIRAQLTAGPKKSTYIKSSVSKCIGGQILTTSAESGRGSVVVDAQGGFRGVTTKVPVSNPTGNQVRGFDGSVTSDGRDGTLNISGIGPVIIEKVRTNSDGTTIIHGHVIEQLGEPVPMNVAVPIYISIFDCAPTPGTITPPNPSPSPTPGNCPDLTDSFALNQTRNFTGVLGTELELANNSTPITGFRLLQADNPTAVLTNVSNCSASILFSANFTTAASFNTITTNSGGECEWSGPTTLTSDFIIFLDVFTSGTVQTVGQPLIYQVLGPGGQKVGTVRTTVVP